MSVDTLGGSTATSDSYGIGRATMAIIAATVLVAVNIGLMMLVAPTALAGVVIWMYESAPFSPWLGLLVMSALLSVGRLMAYTALGFDAVEPENTYRPKDVNTGLAVLGLAATMFAFALFGGAALSIVGADLRLTVVAISVAITGAITLVAGGAELVTERSLAGLGMKIRTFGMIGGIAVLFVGYVISWLGGPGNVIYIVAFGLIVLGWIGDLLHEISVLTRDDRSVLVNAFGLYAAVTGVLVHIIWLVARAYAED